jgi:hypothetical protein
MPLTTTGAVLDEGFAILADAVAAVERRST